jgi:DNA-binding MarR family transcriptional regulator
MNSEFITLYQDVCEKTYYVYTIWHREGIRQYLKDRLSLRDIQMLNFVEKSKQTITTDILAPLFFLKKNALSNRLTYFEHNDLINRVPDPTDKRKNQIHLKKAGSELIDYYNQYLKKMISTINKNLKPLELIHMSHAISKVIDMLFEKPGLFPESLKFKKPKELNNQFLFFLNYYYSTFDYELIKNNDFPMDAYDLFTLSELYIDSQKGHSNLMELSKKMLMPYQTLVSKVKKFQAKEWIFKPKNGPYDFSQEAIQLVRDYIYQKVIVYQQTMALFNEKEAEVMMNVFQSIKHHAKSYIEA